MLWVCVPLAPAHWISLVKDAVFNRIFQSLTGHLRTRTVPPPLLPLLPLLCPVLTWLSLSLEAVRFSFHSGVIQAFPLQEMFVIYSRKRDYILD